MNKDLILKALEKLEKQEFPIRKYKKPNKPLLESGYLYEDIDDRISRRKRNQETEEAYNRDLILYLISNFTKEDLLLKLGELHYKEDHNSIIINQIKDLENEINNLKGRLK